MAIQSPEEWEATQPKMQSPEEWEKSLETKGEKEAVAKGQVYVKPLPGLSAETTASIYSGAEAASSTVRGALQFLQEKFPGLEEHMPEAFKKSTIEEEVKTRKALEKSPEYKKGAIAGEIAGTLADPVTYALPLGKASTLPQFIKQSAVMGGVGGFIGAKTEEDSRGREALIGTSAGVVGGTVLGTVMRAGGKLFGKDFLPWKASAEEKEAIAEEVAKVAPEEEVAKVNHFLDASEDAHINAKKRAESLIEEGAPKTKTDKARKQNPLVGHYLDEYQSRHEAIKEAHGLSGRKAESGFGVGGATEDLQRKKAAFVKEQEALKAAGESREVQKEIPKTTTYKDLVKAQGGFASPKLAADIAGAGIGAGLSPDDPLTGAMEGLAIAHGGITALEKFSGKGLGEKIVNKISSEESPSIIKESQQMVASTMNEIRSRERNTFSVSKEVNDIVPDVARREYLSTVIEHPDLVKTLSPTERKAYDKLKSAFNEVGKRATDAEVIHGMRENYITHIVDWEKSPTKIDEALNYFLGKGGAKGGTIGITTSKFGKERKYETIEDLTKALKESGLTLKTKDASEIFRTYANSMEKAIAGKNLVKDLKSRKLPDGTPLLLNIREGKFIPSGWNTSKSVFLQGYAVHPEVAPILEHMFASNSPGAIMQALTSLSNLSKRLNVMGSFFHAASLGQALISSGYGTAIKEVATGFKGTREAVKMFQKGGIGDKADSWIKSGLVLEVPGDVDKAALAHVGSLVDGLAAKAGLNLPTEKVLSAFEQKTMGLIDKVTWDYAHTGFKLLTAEKYLEKARIDHPDVPVEELRKEIIKYVNNSFGSLNWTQIAADSSNRALQEMVSPKGRQSLNLLMFAPDWTTSTLRAFTSMFGKGSGLKGIISPRYTADFARRYQMRSALIYFTLLNGVNQITSGHPIWENKKDKTRIEFRDGTTMQMSKHAMEPIHWITDPEKTLSNKLGFIPHAAITYWGEKEYPFGPELEDKSALGKTKRIGEQMLPFQAQAAMQAPAGAGMERAVAGTLGLPIYGKTPEQMAADRVKRAQLLVKKRREIMERMAR